MFMELGCRVPAAVSEVGLGDEVGSVEMGDADEVVVLDVPSAVVKTVGGALEGGSDVPHEIPAKQLIPLGHPSPVGQAVVSEQLDMASS